MTAPIIELNDLKVGDEVPADAVFRVLYIPIFSDTGCEYLCLENVPVAALVPSS
jgi:hypothetical protein